MPRFLHEPFVQRPSDPPAGRQNTDPSVFENTFLYSNCRQFTPLFNPSQIQHLAPGSIILFGSKLHHRFVLDTLMVIDSGTPYVVGEPDSFGEEVPDTFRAAALEPLAASRRLAGRKASLYRGVMHGPGQQEIFSFVPAWANDRPFARPALRDLDEINPESGQSAKATVVSAHRAAEVWHDVVTQIRGQDLDLALFLAEPEIVPGQAGLDRLQGRGCAEGPTH